MSKDKAIVNVSSNDSINAVRYKEGSRFSVLLSPPLTLCKYFQVLSVELPGSYYAINSTNNSFFVTSAGSSTLVTIPPGNYNPTSLATATTLAMAAASLVGYTLAPSLTIDNDGKFTISHASATFTLDATAATMAGTGSFGASQLLGLDYYQASTFVAPTAALLPNVANVTGDQYVYVCCPNIASGYNYGNSRTSDSLLKVPTTAAIGTTNFYQQRLSSEWTEFCLNRNQDYSSLTFYLQDSNGFPLDLNGVSWSLTLGFSKSIY